MTPAQLRAELVHEGRIGDPLPVVPSDLARFSVAPWTGVYLGMACVEELYVIRIPRSDGIGTVAQCIAQLEQTQAKAVAKTAILGA